MSTGAEDVAFMRTVAISAVEQHGWVWPSILDEEFPAVTPGGLEYDRVIIEYVSALPPSPHFLIGFFLTAVNLIFHCETLPRRRPLSRHMRSRFSLTPSLYYQLLHHLPRSSRLHQLSR
jgi:hypothetical protein